MTFRELIFGWVVTIIIGSIVYGIKKLTKRKSIDKLKSL